MRDMAAAQVSASAAEVAYLAAVLSDKYVTFALACCYVTCNFVTILLMPTGLSWSGGASMHTYGRCVHAASTPNDHHAHHSGSLCQESLLSRQHVALAVWPRSSSIYSGHAALTARTEPKTYL